jgi:hypothetical protein
MKNPKPLRSAQYAWEHSHTWSSDLKVNAAIELGEYKIFSVRTIAAIVRLHPAKVGEYVQKKDKTGGRFAPDSLPLLVKITEALTCNERDWRDVQAVYRLGTSQTMINRYTGLAPATISRMVNHA